MPILSAVRLRSPAEEFEVKEKNRGTPPNGFTIGKSARNVALAAAGNVLSKCATTFGAVIVNSRCWLHFHPCSSWVHLFPFSGSAEALCPDVFATVAAGDKEVGRIFDE